MAASGQKRTRSERVAALELPPGQWERAWAGLRRRDVLGRIGLALLAALLIGFVIRAWDPPFAYRAGDVPSHDVVARIHVQQQRTDQNFSLLVGPLLPGSTSSSSGPTRREKFWSRRTSRWQTATSACSKRNTGHGSAEVLPARGLPEGSSVLLPWWP